MRGKQVSQSRPVAHIEIEKFRLASRNCSDVVDGGKPAVAQVIDDEYVVARCQQLDDGVRTDVSGPTRYQDRRSRAHERSTPERTNIGYFSTCVSCILHRLKFFSIATRIQTRPISSGSIQSRRNSAQCILNARRTFGVTERIRNPSPTLD